MLLSTGNIFANDLNEIDPSETLSIQISRLLHKNSFTQNDVELSAQVRFTLNREQEIVVLSVDTENRVLEEFVKQRLNYRKVVVDKYKEGELYTIPVRIVR